MSLASCVQNLIWLKRFSRILREFLDENTVKAISKISIVRENQACIADAKTPVLSEYTKPFDIKYRYLVDNIAKEDIGIHNVPTEDMVADVFTENVEAEKFKTFVHMFGMEQCGQQLMSPS